MSRRRLRPSPADDPGDAWVDQVLAPLRRQGVALDVAPAVMARLAAARSRGPLPAIFARPRIAWGLSVGVGVAAFCFLTATVAVLARGGEGIAQIRAIAVSSRRLASIAWTLAVTVGDRVATVAAPLLRTMGTLMDVSAPLLRGAGLAAATAGALSILISLYVFTHARGSAPPTGAPTGVLRHGGTR